MPKSQEKKLARLLQPVPGPVSGLLTVFKVVGLDGDREQSFPLPTSGVFQQDVQLGGVYADVWLQDGLTYVNANVASWQQAWFVGTPYELRWNGSAGSLVFGDPLEFNSVGIEFAGAPVDVGYSATGGWNTNVQVNRNGAKLVVNEVSGNSAGVSSTGLHLVVPGVGEAWFNVASVTF